MWGSSLVHESPDQRPNGRKDTARAPSGTDLQTGHGSLNPPKVLVARHASSPTAPGPARHPERSNSCQLLAHPAQELGGWSRTRRRDLVGTHDMTDHYEESDNPYRTGYARIAIARNMLKRSADLMAATAKDVPSLEPFGTQELPAAIKALSDAMGDDDREAVTRWVISCLDPCTNEVSKHGEAGVSFAAAAVMLRCGLKELDDALDSRKQADVRAAARRRAGLADT